MTKPISIVPLSSALCSTTLYYEAYGLLRIKTGISLVWKGKQVVTYISSHNYEQIIIAFIFYTYISHKPVWQNCHTVIIMDDLS